MYQLQYSKDFQQNQWNQPSVPAYQSYGNYQNIPNTQIQPAAATAVPSEFDMSCDYALTHVNDDVPFESYLNPQPNGIYYFPARKELIFNPETNAVEERMVNFSY
jgi:hypothetical protein